MNGVIANVNSRIWIKRMMSYRNVKLQGQKHMKLLPEKLRNENERNGLRTEFSNLWYF